MKTNYSVELKKQKTAANIGSILLYFKNLTYNPKENKSTKKGYG